MHLSILPMLENIGYEVHYKPDIKQEEVFDTIELYSGLILRSKIFIGKEILERAHNLKFIARAGAGMDQIVEEEVLKRNIKLINAPEGNRNAVAEHVLGSILTLFNKIHTANFEVKNGVWLREENRGYEIEGKTVAIIGYGNNGKAFAKCLKGFDCKVLAYDILPSSEYADENAIPSSMETIFNEADIVSFHTPLTSLTENLVNKDFLQKFKKNIWLFNSSRGKVVVINDLLDAIDNGKVLGAGLDVLPIENLNKFKEKEPKTYERLMNNPKILLTPHVAGWTHESHMKINKTLVEKIKSLN